MAGIVKNGREKTDLFAASHLVCFWHKADIDGPGLVASLLLVPAATVPCFAHGNFPSAQIEAK